MFAKQFRFLRQSRELNQVQLADKLGVTKQSVSNWENDNIVPSVDMLIKIADYFDVTTDYLLGREIVDSNTLLTMDVSGLTPKQIEHIQFIVDDLRGNSEELA